MMEWASWLMIDPCSRSVESMVEAAARWASAIKRNESPRWLILLGTTGAGKTHIAKRLWKWLKSKQDFTTSGEYIARSFYWPEFVEDLRSGNAYGEFRDAMRWNYCLIDDAASERVSEFSTEKLHNLLGARVGKWTIITSNKGMSDIQNLDARIASRFLRDDSFLVDVRTKDYNLRSRL
jgi:chromosomal replication initiation ATPase DnaA